MKNTMPDQYASSSALQEQGDDAEVVVVVDDDDRKRDAVVQKRNPKTSSVNDDDDDDDYDDDHDDDDEEDQHNGPYIHLDFAFHMDGEAKCSVPFDDHGSLDSSVESGLRNSLHSGYDFEDLEKKLEDLEDFSDVDSFGGGGGSDGDEFGTDQKEMPSWRLNRTASGSDFTMVVQSVPDGTLREYHVHKCVLVEGLKRSDLFVSIFNEEERTGSGKFPLSKVHADAAIHIPEMLDYLYSTSDGLEITTETAVSLRHLSQYFGIRALATEVVSFIYEDMKIGNMKTYLQTANVFDDLATQKLCSQRCAENIKDINPFSDLMTEIDPSFLLDIISSPKADRSKCSAHLSRLVAVYCNLHRDVIDGTVFEELTAVEYLPSISKGAALNLLTLEAELVEDARNEKRGLTSLQKRCSDALSGPSSSSANKPKEEMDEKEQRKRARVLKKLPKKVLVEILSRTLCIS